MYKNKYNTILKYLFLFFIFFPYLTPIDTPWSLQPYSFFLSLFVILLHKNHKINKRIIYFLSVSLFSILVGVLSLSDIINSIRSIANYVSFPFIVWASILVNPTSTEVKFFIKGALLVYFSIGLLQITLIPGFLSFLVPHQGTSDDLFLSGRGVASLTPEPSYFGFIMFLFYFLGIFFNSKLLKIVSLFSIIFLARSITVFFCLFISLFILFAFKNKRRFLFSLFFTFLLLIISYIFILNYVSDSRALILIQSFFSDGFTSTIDNDVSAAGRLYHITYPISESFKNFLIPFGYNGLPNGDTRILSGIAGAIYELGIISIILFYNIIGILFQKNEFKYNVRISIGIGLLLFILNANQIGMPVFCFIISLIMYSNSEFSNRKIILSNNLSE